MKLGRRVSAAWKALTGKRSAFEGAQVNRLTMDWIGSPANVNDLLKSENATLRARAQELARNNAYVRQYLTLLSVNVIGPEGITLQAQIRDNSGNLSRRINDSIEAAWADWSTDVAVDSRLSMSELSKLALTATATDGEAFLVMIRNPRFRYGFRLRLVEASRVDEGLSRDAGRGGNEIRQGIEVDVVGRPVAYHFKTDAPGEAGKHTRVPAEQVIHVFRPKFPGQSRGFSWLAPVMLPLRMLAGYEEAELVAARTAAAKMAWLTWTDPEAAPEEDSGAVDLEASPGSVSQLPYGLEFQEWSPEHPTSAFPEFVKAQLRRVAAGLGVSYNALANDLEGVNYSSIRSGLLIERDSWRDLQRFWIATVLDRVYRAWLDAARLSPDLALDSREPSKFYAVRWIPRGWAWVDPLKDGQAAVLAINNGLSSRTEQLAERGLDFEEVLENLEQEQELAKQYRVTISGSTGTAAAPAPSATSAGTDGSDAGDPAGDTGAGNDE